MYLVKGLKKPIKTKAKKNYTYIYISEWSVIYVGIFISLLLAGSICGIFFLNFKKQKPRNNKSNSRSSSRKNSGYTRLEQNDQNFELRSKLSRYTFFVKSQHS